MCFVSFLEFGAANSLLFLTTLDFDSPCSSNSMFNDGPCNNSRVVKWKVKHDIGDMEKLVKNIGERGRGRVYGVLGTGELSKDATFI